MANVSASVMREMFLNGTPDEVIDQAAEWRDCGVRYIVVASYGFLQPSFRKGLESVLPFNKVLTGLKKL